MRCGSEQRNYIIEYMRSNYSHPTAYEIYEGVREKFPKVSLGTVYRNLEYLTENNVIKKIQKAGTTDRYDFVRGRHNHAMCSVCGAITDFDFPLDKSKLQTAVGDKITISDADFLVVGICAECRAKRENQLNKE